MNELIAGNVFYSGIAAGLYTGVRTYQHKESCFVEALMAGTLSAVLLQRIVYIYARYKAKVNEQTPDTYTYQYLGKQPMSNAIRVTAVVGGIAIYHFAKSSE